jgi:hypothetical protein
MSICEREHASSGLQTRKRFSAIYLRIARGVAEGKARRARRSESASANHRAMAVFKLQSSGTELTRNGEQKRLALSGFTEQWQL